MSYRYLYDNDGNCTGIEINNNLINGPGIVGTGTLPTVPTTPTVPTLPTLPTLPTGTV
ncbi:hypothetical protein JCM19037_2614 [Geomicrobium sp. JCM 19037]|uniref:hypothetical protein n=1 Tax=unclassified Geomicrobium TaxID=2628951 RepID=UPI00045F36FF|nr:MULTISPECIES: hypothetical protein [unclassified Geomicrobium]GAK04226.1 hypothetical protein JCM19037_2614 [Geomicrobium sp. JCM 19037]GAK14189.1 hypothetical protein JCM19039_4088 [Geomicrobium sp. JCM 19039]